MASLPVDLRSRVHNVAIVIRRRPSPADLRAAGLDERSLLLGLYTGIPLTKRDSSYNLVLPDTITIYQDHVEAVCRDDAEIREQVRTTVLHELGHYFGIDDERLEQLGLG